MTIGHAEEAGAFGPFGSRLNIAEIFSAQQRIKPKQALFSKEEQVRHIYYLHSGICAAYDMLSDGRRQIVSLHLPGELLGIASIVRDRSGHNIVAISDVVVGVLDLAQVRSLLAERRSAYDAFLAQMAKHNSILEVWVSALGRKSAMERMALLFCEVAYRMKVAGLGDGTACPLPLSQADVADILGISVVHVNRVLKTMRDTKLASFDGRKLEIHTFDRLAALA